MKLTFSKITLWCLLFSFTIIKAQDVVNNQYWLDYSPSFKISEKVNFSSSVGFRTIDSKNWKRYYITGKFKYKRPKRMLKKLFYSEHLSAGVSIYFTDNNYISNVLEIRPFQSYSLSWPDRKRIKLNHHLILEERFELVTDNWSNTFGLRLRYRATTTFKFQGDVVDFGKGFYIPISLNLFWNLIDTKQFNDKVRITPGIGYVFSPKWKAAFLVGYQYSRQTKDDDFHTNDIIFRLRAYHNLDK